MYKLYLDDVRNPVHYTGKDDYIWVKTYTEFRDYILQNGMPKFISFDHDLGQEATGKDCADWLVEHCMDNNLPLPEYYVHSANPVGRDNIIGLLENFKNKWAI